MNHLWITAVLLGAIEAYQNTINYTLSFCNYQLGYRLRRTFYIPRNETKTVHLVATVFKTVYRDNGNRKKIVWNVGYRTDERLKNKLKRLSIASEELYIDVKPGQYTANI